MSDIPEKLGKYEIRREIGRGAMGHVYEGWDPAIGRRVALKVLRREQLDRAESEEIISRFQREAQAAGRLTHPNIVGVYEFGEDASGTAFIAMEYIDGRELRDCFDRQERFSLPDIVRLMTELLGAIGHAHSNGIVHRDIKPANIFILANGQSKIGDFGIARIESSNLTQVGSVIGTPAYMSPEQFMGQRVDGRSDLFSAGIILYQFLSGEKPFSGQLTTIMHKVLKEDPIAPSELNVQVPKAFDAVVRKAMAKRPEDRYQSALEFAEALQAALASANAPFNDNAGTPAPVIQPSQRNAKMIKRTFYDILQVSSTASTEVITAAYNKIRTDLEAAAKLGNAEARNEMIFVEEAYATLSSPIRRRDYDARFEESTVIPAHRPAAVRVAEPETVLQQGSGSTFLDWWHSGVTAKLMVAAVIFAGVFAVYKFTGQGGKHRLEDRRIDVESVRASGAVDNDAYRAENERIKIEGSLQNQDKLIDRSYEIAKQREDRLKAASEQRAQLQEQREEARRKREEENRERREIARQEAEKRQQERQAKRSVADQKRELCNIYRSQGRRQEARALGC